MVENTGIFSSVFLPFLVELWFLLLLQKCRILLRRFLSACIHLCDCYFASYICLLHYLLVCYVDVGASSLTALVTCCLHVVSASSARFFRLPLLLRSIAPRALLFVHLYFDYSSTPWLLIDLFLSATIFSHKVLLCHNRIVIPCFAFTSPRDITSLTPSFPLLPSIVRTLMLRLNASAGTRRLQIAMQN